MGEREQGNEPQDANAVSAVDAPEGTAEEAAPQPAPAPPPPSESELLKARLDDAQARLRTVSKAFSDLQGEMDAFRARMENQGRQKAERQAFETVQVFLDPVQNLKRCVATPGDDIANLLMGLQMVQNQFVDALTRLGLQPVPGEGSDFDPRFHEALAVSPVAEPEQDGKVLVVHQGGWQVNGKVLQAAQVVIGKFEQAAKPDRVESSQLRSMAVLAVVLLALTAALAFWEPEPVLADVDATTRVVEAIDPAQAVGIRILQAAGERTDTVVLGKTDGIWQVREPFQADADVDAVLAVLEAYRQSERGVPVDGALATFGLEPPRVVAELTLEDGRVVPLVLGDASPVGWRTYAQAADGRVAAVSGKPGDAFLKRPQEFRDHRIFHYDPDEVTRVSIDSALGLLEARKSGDAWFLTGFGRADLVELDAWITDLLDLRVELFLDLDHTTVADPRFTVQVETPAGVQEMRVGRDTPHGPLVFWDGHLDGVVDPNLLTQLERGPTDVGVSQAFPFDPHLTEAILRMGEVEARSERGSEGWGNDPIAEVLDRAQLVYRAEPPVWSTAVLTVELVGERSAVIDVGPVDAEGFRPVRDTAGGEAMRVPAEELAPLFVR